MYIYAKKVIEYVTRLENLLSFENITLSVTTKLKSTITSYNFVGFNYALSICFICLRYCEILKKTK